MAAVFTWVKHKLEKQLELVPACGHDGRGGLILSVVECARVRRGRRVLSGEGADTTKGHRTCLRLLGHAEECGVTASLLRWSRLIVVWSVTLLSGPSLVAAPTGTAQEGATDGL